MNLPGICFRDTVMFSIRQIPVRSGILQERREQYTGLRCRISPERIKRHINQDVPVPSGEQGCPFCPENVLTVTPEFPDRHRILRGESVTFPNLFPFSEWHTVTVITKAHTVENFSHRQIEDALTSQAEALSRFDGYPSINWNYLPSAGASLVHPHMQALSGRTPSVLAERYLSASRRYLARHGHTYWDAVRRQEEGSDRFLFGDEIFWHAHAVPIGEREIRGILPVSCTKDLAGYIPLLAKDMISIISLYRRMGTRAFNMALFFDRKDAGSSGFSAFCSFISRINPNPRSTSDSAFMERLHLEPVILTLPEDLGAYYRNEQQ